MLGFPFLVFLVVLTGFASSASNTVPANLTMNTTSVSPTPQIPTGPIVFHCIRGTYCELMFNTRTSQIQNAQTSSISIAALKGGELWLSPGKKGGLIGVPMAEGSFHFILGFSDQNSENVEIPFEVSVSSAPSPNHKFEILMDQPSVENFMGSALIRTNFLKKLAESLKAPIHDITIENAGSSKNKTSIVFFNNSFSVHSCDEIGIRKMKFKMILERKKRTKAMFIYKMGRNHFVRKVTFEALTNCREAFNVPIPKLEDPKSKKLIVIGSIVFGCGILLLLLIVIVYVLMKRKSETLKQEENESMIEMIDVDSKSITPSDRTETSTASTYATHEFTDESFEDIII